ncbi:LPXTG cell wall anchor domain-containing protein [Bacillus sp. DNRA2]|uniref:choice-of-anchor L domain-containing protein n=1 Tax=Bacillus sp. DNRA2 TaxID=2723053 RepID=UPI00145DB706|nr:choice-of-anchor L domain-containing protein [Bacillus sp. DNRA2]NMD68795.1 LPXTG cell wall anchor domain-containing protein [Bacillus sp. DNRA2]
MRRKLKKRRKAVLLCFLSLMIVLPANVFANVYVSDNGQVEGTVSTQENEIVADTVMTNPDTNPVVDEETVPIEEEQTGEQPNGGNISPPAPEAPKDEVLPSNEGEQQVPVVQQEDTPIAENQDVKIELNSKADEQTIDLQLDENTDKVPLKRGENAYQSYFSLLAAEGGLSTADLNTVTKEQLVEKLVGDDIEISNVTFNGANHAAGTFSGGAGIIGFTDGIILSNGNIVDVIGPNDDSGVSTANGTGGDEDLHQLVPDFELNDAAVLEFDFIPIHDTLRFRYVFSSEEYNEYVNEGYNDVFGFFVNGQNIALIPDTNLPVSIHNINLDANSQYFINNEIDEPDTEPTLAMNALLAEPLNTQMDGLTVVMTATTTVKIGEVNHIKLAIADASDDSVDSNVFIEAGSFSSIDTKAPIKPEVLEVDDNDQALTGTTEPGATVIVKVGDMEIGNTKADAAGKFTLTIPKQNAGTILEVYARDEAGNTSEPTTLTVVDKTAPAQPTVNKVTDQDTSVSGQAESKAKIEVKVNGFLIASSTAGEDGKFAVLIPKQAGGTTLVITATDAAGNISEAVSVVVTKMNLTITLSQKLPDTATNNFNLLFAGIALVIIGGTRLVFRRRDEK